MDNGDFAAAGSACLEPSRGVIGEYKVDYETLGVGSNVCVRLGYHLLTGQKVAVKIVDVCQSSVRDRAQLEAEALRNLNNKHIIKLYTVNTIGQHLYLFLEYVDGGDLATFIERYGRLEELQAHQYFVQIVSAIEHCHHSGIIHHDIKLENILISQDRQTLKLIDFGLCTKVPKKGHMITDYAGSPLFMSPEVFTRQPHTESTDIWSLGVCLYKMMTDLFPFMADTYYELEERVLFEDVIFPMNMGLSNALKDLILRMLTKDPKKRIPIKKIKEHKWYNNIDRFERPSSDLWGLDDDSDDSHYWYLD